MMPIDYFLLVICFALFNTGLYIVALKWGFIAWLQFHVSELLWPTRCIFCFYFRLAVIEVFTGVAYVGFQPLSLLPILGLPLVMAVISLKFTPSEINK